MLNAESRGKIINDNRDAITTNLKKADGSSTARNLIVRTLNLHGKEQTVAKEKLVEETDSAKKTSMSWLDKLSSTTFVKGETIDSDIKVKGIVSSGNFLKEQSKSEVSKETSSGKITFADLDKQQRFEQYLKFSESERQMKFESIQPLSMTDWERKQEVEEFEKTARLCENLNKSPAAKMEASKENDASDVKLSLENLNSEDRMKAAARMKMFGSLTRTKCEWKPVKLLCVRFNIAEPSVGVATEKKEKKKFSIFDSLTWNNVSKFEKGKYSEEREFEPKPSTSFDASCDKETIETNHRNKMSLEESGTKIKLEPVFQKSKDVLHASKQQGLRDAEDKEEELESRNVDRSFETKTSNNPTNNMNFQEKKNLYKSIFLSSSSEDSESEPEDSRNANDEKLKSALIGKNVAQLNLERNSSPPRGIFAKLDLDSLLKGPEKKNLSKDVPKDVEVEVAATTKSVEDVTSLPNKMEGLKEEEDQVEVDPNVYGPALPKVLLQSNESFAQSSLFSKLSKKAADLQDSHWVEKSKSKKKVKKEKKKHKHKDRSRSKSRKKVKKEKKH